MDDQSRGGRKASRLLRGGSERAEKTLRFLFSRYARRRQVVEADLPGSRRGLELLRRVARQPIDQKHQDEARHQSEADEEGRQLWAAAVRLFLLRLLCL